MPLIASFSGVRGIVDDGLNEQIAARFVQAYYTFLKKKHKTNLKVVIGTDTRPSRTILRNTVIEVAEGTVIDVGIASTPMTEFAVRHYKAHGGIIITASHNEPYWNGFKFLGNDGGVLSEKEMAQVIDNYEKPKKAQSKKMATTKGMSKKVLQKAKDVQDAYATFALSFLSKKEKDILKKSKPKIVIDPNGGTGIIAKSILEKIGVGVVGVNMKYGEFNRTVEPNEASLIYLANAIREHNALFAAGFDCDADRVELMTSHGLVSGNHLLALITDDILSAAKNKVVVVNNATSNVVKAIAKKHKARYIETDVGETHVVKKLYAVDAPVGGEGSSAGVIVPPSRCRDGVVTLLLVLSILAKRDISLEVLVKQLPTYYNLKTKLTVTPKQFAALEKKIVIFYQKKKKIVKKSKAGSLKVMLSQDSYVWFRTSKTEANVLRIISDAPTSEDARQILDEAKRLVK